jgi:hypothetical protein
MVPFAGAPRQPLLPYEKYLIEALGCSEEEYRQFAKQVATQSLNRAGYEHIPNVQNTGVLATIAVSLLVSGITTAAAYLLTPKPEQQDYDRRPGGTQRQLGSATGRELYTPTYGFDSTQDLAAYGNIVPIVFTLQSTQVNSRGHTYTSGGVLVSPALVWSRIKSWGSYQVSEIVGVVGQGPMARPDLAGVYLGNAALDSIYTDYFDFYWNGAEASTTTSRLLISNKQYGNLRLDDGSSGGSDAFYAPTRQGGSQPAFSGAFTPTSQTRFGVYSGVPNGTPVRPDWKVVSVSPDMPQIRQNFTEVQRYVDPYLLVMDDYGGWYDNVFCGMPGTGRNYASRIGIIEHRSASTGVTTTHNFTVTTASKFGKTVTQWENLTREVTVNKDDTIVILLGQGEQALHPFEAKDFDTREYDIDLKDIQSRVRSENTRYDQLFDLGATFMIGRSTWRVIERPSERYDPERNKVSGYRIRLQCIEAWSESQRKIGIVASGALTASNQLANSNISEAFYPIVRYEIATIQNNRSCDVTELCLKSQVWTRFNGITNFNTLPSPASLAKDNKDRIRYTEGKLTSYAHRISLFALDVRPADTEGIRSTNRNEGWVFLGPYLFAVIGDSPIDLYSFIRITHPVRGQYEYRLRPMTSAYAIQIGNSDFTVFSLAGDKTPYTAWTADTDYGSFSVGGRGRFVNIQDFVAHREMTDDLATGYWVDDLSKMDVKLESVICTQPAAVSTYTVGQACRNNTLSNIMTAALGVDPYTSNIPVGTRTKITNWTYSVSGRSVVVSITVECYEAALSASPRNRWWRIIDTDSDVTSFTGKWNTGDTFVIYANSGDGDQFAFTYSVSFAKTYVPGATTTARQFQRYSGIAEVSHYGDLITRSCDSGPEHSVIAVNECLSEDLLPNYQNCALAGLKVKSSNNFQQLDQLRCYLKTGLKVYRLIEQSYGPSNLLTDLAWYLLRDTDTGAGNIVSSELIDQAAMTTTGRYLRANRLFFDDAISEPINIRSWLAQTAPSVLCFTSLKNGKFSIEPALPYDSSYKIDPNGAIKISAMFTEGNMIEDSFEVTWLELEQRKMFQAAVAYRTSESNRLPEQKTVVVRYTSDGGNVPVEEFTFNHITGDEHAVYAARYFLALRKHITHNITFKTLPWGLELEPGAYIRVSSQSSPYNPANNGIVKEDGTVIAVSPMSNGTYDVYYWERSLDYVQRGNLIISNGVATNLRNSVFSVINSNAVSEVYQIEALDVDADGIVTVKASNYPIDSSGRSLIARDVLDVNGVFEIVGGSLT